jgi:hypothetical protein
MATAPFDLHWSLTTPKADADGDAITYRPAELPTLVSDYFKIYDTYVEFIAPVVGTTTNKSEKTRSELREWLPDGSGEKNWLGSGGNHSMGAAFSVHQVPTSNDAQKLGSVFVGQIHADEGLSPLLKFKFQADSKNTGKMKVSFRPGPDQDANSDETLTPSIEFGARIQYYAKVNSSGQLSAYVEVGGVQYPFTASLSDWLSKKPDQKFYFKAGVYNNKKPEDAPVSKGDASIARFYKLTTTHS